MEDAEVTPGKAYDAIMATYGLTCATPALARSAQSRGGRYASPIYSYVNR